MIKNDNIADTGKKLKNLFTLTNTWKNVLLMIVIPYATLIAINRLGDIGISIIFGIAVFFYVVIFKKITFKFFHGIMFGIIAGLINFILPQAFGGSIIIAAWVFLFFGALTWIIDKITPETTKPYPWWMFELCLITALICIFISIISGTWGVNLYKNYFYNFIYDFLYPQEQISLLHYKILMFLQPLADNYIFIRSGAEISRVYLILYWLSKAFQWIIAGLIILATTSPILIKKWWNNSQGSGFRGLVAGALLALGYNKLKK